MYMFQNFYLVECIIISFICTFEFANTSEKQIQNGK